MKRHNTLTFIRILCTLVLGVTAFLLLSSSTHAGEFGATFNQRLTCKMSSWHEGKVVGINSWFITVDVTKDLLRHTKTNRFRTKYFPNAHKDLKRGDIVLINFHKDHLSPATPDCAGSLINGPPLVGRIDNKNRTIHSFMAWGYSSRMLTWFYRTKRWDARVVYISSKKSKSGIHYAVLPNGKKYLIYDEHNLKRPMQYVVSKAKK